MRTPRGGPAPDLPAQVDHLPRGRRGRLRPPGRRSR